MKKKLIINMSLFVLMLMLFVTASFSWFSLNNSPNGGDFEVEVTVKDIRIKEFNVYKNGSINNIDNIFESLLPGTEFVFELTIVNDGNATLDIDIGFFGIYGDIFEGKNGEKYTMKNLFYATIVDESFVPELDGETFSFNNDSNNSLNITNTTLKSKEELTIRILMEFLISEEIKQNINGNELKKKTFSVKGIYISFSKLLSKSEFIINIL